MLYEWLIIKEKKNKTIGNTNIKGRRWGTVDALRIGEIQHYFMLMKKMISYLMGTHLKDLETIELLKVIAFFFHNMK